MKHILSFIFFLSFSLTYCFAEQAFHSDSLGGIDFKSADSTFKRGDYEKACSLYYELKGQVVSDYDKINSTTIEDLRKQFPINKVRVEKEIAQNSFIHSSVVAIFSLIVFFVFAVIFMRGRNRMYRRKKKELELAKADAEESIQKKSLYLSNMSHEIKTPLNALSGFAQVLTNDDIDDVTRKQCNDIIQLNSQLLLKLLNDVVDLSCLDFGNMKYTIAECEVIELCRNVVSTVSLINQSKAVVLFHSDLQSLILQTDEDRLKQLLVNLLVNATKFTAQGSITLEVSLNAEGFAQFSVTDTGCGILPEARSKVFNRFEKLDESKQGTGLGLSICKLIIERLGGRIWVDPDYNSGSRFIFVHPIKQPVV